MIKQDWADGRVFAQIVLVRGIVSVPSDHIERRMIEIRRPQRAAPFNKHSGRSVSIFVRRYRSEEVAWIGETVGSDRPAFRQGEGASIVLAKISARRARRQLDPHFNAARDHRNLARLDVDNTELGPEAQITLLRHDQHLTIGVVEVLVLHGSRNEIEMGAHARLGAGISCRRHGANALDKGKTLIRDWDGIPAHGRNRKLGFLRRRRAPKPDIDLGELGPMPDDWTDAIQPGALVGGPGRRERRSRELFCIETVRTLLGGVTPDGQRARYRYGL